MKKILRYIHYYYALTLICLGLVTKYFLTDTNLGSRFKNFNHELLASDITFICALMVSVVGSIFYAIRNNRKSTILDSTIILNAILIIPITLILAITPAIETIQPGEIGDGLLSWIVVIFTMIGTIALFLWIILLVLTIIKQSFIILTNKKGL